MSAMERPNVPAMDELEAVFRNIQDLEDAIRELKRRVPEIAKQIASQIANKEELRKAADYLYWKVPEVPTSVINNDLLGADPDLFRSEAIGTLTCERCGNPIVFRSRTHMKDVMDTIKKDRIRYAEGYTALCDLCRQEIQAEREIQFKKNMTAYRERLRELKTMPYYEYLQTPEWKQRRQRHLRSANYRCQVCNANGVSLNVHHRTYERRGEEHYKDLIALCQGCHELFHREGRLAEEGNEPRLA